MKDDSIASYDPQPISREEKTVCPNKKETFRSVRDDLIGAYHCLKAIGEQEIGDALWKVIHTMFYHETLGSLKKSNEIGSEGA